MAQVTLKNISRHWGNFTAVKDFNLEIADGEFLVLLGPSGCGKTTTMRMIAGLEETSEGEIWIGDRIVNNLEPKDRDIAMVFQSYGLYPTMSVYENIRFPLKVRRVPQDQHDVRVRRASAMVELDDFLHRRPAELSGGQRQRVALARAIVRQPTVFLMDEPLSNLDAKLRVSTRAQIKNLHHELKTTTVYVTHDQIEAMTLADRVVVMNKGLVQQVGSPSDIYDTPANTFVASFIGSPAMNLLKGELNGGVFKGENISVKGLPQSHNGAITLGFRAEDAQLSAKAAQIAAPVYTMELLGEASLVTVKAGSALVAVKATKDTRIPIGAGIHAAIAPEHCHLFDAQSGERLNITEGKQHERL